MFGKILKAMAGGLALRKLFDGWFLQNEAKEAKKKFQETLDKAEKESKERLKKLPKDEQDYILRMIGEKPRKE